MDSMLHVRRSPAQTAEDPADGMAAFFAASEAFPAVREVTLECAQPNLLKSLTSLVHQAGPLLPGMEDALDSLKEAFLELLRVKLEENDVSLDARLVLGLDTSGRFGVIDAGHPQYEALQSLLGETPELEAAMREIARQSLLLRGLQDIGYVVGCEGECPADALDLTSLGQDTSYHVCLKGALSHFYFPAR